MRTAILFLMVLFVGCDDFGPRRYELVSAAGGVYLLDTKTGRVWEKQPVAFEPRLILRDSSMLTQLNGQTDPDTKKFVNKTYAYRPNTWSDFFQGLVK